MNLFSKIKFLLFCVLREERKKKNWVNFAAFFLLFLSFLMLVYLKIKKKNVLGTKYHEIFINFKYFDLLKFFFLFFLNRII
jgi:hypothetical protein